MNGLQTLPPETRVTFESAQWVRVWRRHADLEQARGRALLQRAAQQWPANCRLARDATGVVLVADDYREDCDLASDRAQARLLRWLQGDAVDDGQLLDDELIESVLAEFAPLATRREDAWIVPPREESPIELNINRSGNGVTVKATLADLSDASPAAIDAVAEFLCRAHHALRFVRAEIDDRSAWLASFASADRPESDLLHALQAISVGVRLLIRETQALLRPEVAEAYLKSVLSL